MPFPLPYMSFLHSLCHSRAGGNPEQLFKLVIPSWIPNQVGNDIEGFPLPNQFENKLRGNDTRKLNLNLN